MNSHPTLTDTTPEAEQALLELLRQTPPWRKLALMGELNAAVRLLAEQGLRQRYPQADEAEIRRRLAGLLLGEELATRVYGPLQSEESDLMCIELKK